MTDEHVKDHPSLINMEAILADYADCIPPLHLLLPNLVSLSPWFTAHGSIYFRPPHSIDETHTVYLLLPLHLWDPLEPPRV